MKHLHCLSWSIVAALLGFAAVAYGQDPGASVAGDPIMDTLVELVRGGGLPAVLAWLAWWARGALGAGVPLVVQLHPDSLAELRRLRRALERDGEDDERKRGAVSVTESSDGSDPR